MDNEPLGLPEGVGLGPPLIQAGFPPFLDTELFVESKLVKLSIAHFFHDVVTVAFGRFDVGPKLSLRETDLVVHVAQLIAVELKI